MHAYKNFFTDFIASIFGLAERAEGWAVWMPSLFVPSELQSVSPYINRFLQPDTIIPDQSNPQSWNRYSYVQNSPVNFNDPTGHMLDDGDDSGVASLGCGPAELACQVEKSERYNQYKERQRQDELVKRMFSGSGANGEWTNADQYRYFRNRDAFWDNPESWDPNGPKGWELFELHAGRLAANYMPDQKDQFVRDFALVFAGIPSLPSFALAANSVKNGPSQLPFLRYSNAGLANQYIDKREWENQSHHYAGIFALGYFAGAPTGKAVNVARDTDNPGDIALGNVAAQHGSSYWSGNNMDQIVNLISSLGP